jgi:hypothetical protein
MHHEVKSSSFVKYSHTLPFDAEYTFDTLIVAILSLLNAYKLILSQFKLFIKSFFIPYLKKHLPVFRLTYKEISKAELGRTLTTDIGSAGSYSAAKAHDLVRKDLAASDRVRVSEWFNRLAAVWSFYNYGATSRTVNFPSTAPLIKASRPNSCAVIVCFILLVYCEGGEISPR